jgi:pimeloyl-ACP methyl ester carboxylesterase
VPLRRKDLISHKDSMTLSHTKNCRNNFRMKRRMKRDQNYILKYASQLFLLISLILFVSCKSPDSLVEPQEQKRGEIVRTSFLGSYTASVIQNLVTFAAAGQQINITLKYDVDTYKIVYRTLDTKGNITIASAALFVPKGKEISPMISLQHGTQTNRSVVASVNALNSVDGLTAASLGYYTLVPDYLGLGESTILHPYHYAKSSADCVIDLIRAGREFARTSSIKLNGQVFLAGYSEGGYVTLAAHKEIEKNYSSEIKIAACAPMAGAYDLNFTAKTILQKQTYNQPSYLSFFVVAYNEIYGWNRLNEAFNSPYAEKMLSLFDGTKSTSEINAQLTPNISQLFKQNFLNSYLGGTEVDLTAAFTNNSLLNWTPTAPLRFYHGSADEYVPYENSTRALAYFKSVGAVAELITIAGGTHTSSALPSIIDAVNWFETIRLNKRILALY